MTRPCRLVKPLIFPKSHADENPVGYLIRLSELNKYGSYRWLVENENRVAIFSSHRRLVELFKKYKWTDYESENNNVQDLVSMSLVYFIRDTLRYCPLCISENNYYRIVWQLRVEVTCSKHRVWLEDLCPVCNKPLGIALSKISECHCGADIRDAKPIEASLDVLKMQNFLWGSYDSGNSCMPSNNQLSFTEKIDALIFFSRWAHNRTTYKSLASLSAAKENLSDAAEALFAGSSGFINFLRKIHELGYGSGSSKKDLLTRFQVLFYKNFPQPCFSSYKEILEKYINDYWDKPLTKRNRNFGSKTIAQHPWIPFQVACKEFDIHKSKLKRVIEQKLIRSQRDLKDNRTFVNIYRPDLEARINRINDSVTAKEAAAILGLTKAQFAHLREQKIFKVAIPPQSNGDTTWQFSRDEIYLYRDSFVSGIKITDGDLWSFAQLLQYFGGQVVNPLTTILQAIVDKDLYISSLDVNRIGLASMMFVKGDFIRWLEIYRSKSTNFSVTVTAKILNINQEFTYQLVKHGILKSDISYKTNLREIREEYITEFNNEYILLSKLAKKIILNSRTLVSYLASREIYPVDYNESFKLRQKVYRKNDLSNVNILTYFI